MQTKRVSNNIISILLRYAVSIGIDPEDYLKKIHFDRSILEDPLARIPVNQYQDLWKEISSKSKDKFFGLHFGASTNDFCRGNILCAVIMNCPDIGSAIQKFIRYHSILSDLIIPKLIKDNEQAYFSWDVNIPGLRLDFHQVDSYLIMLNSVLHCTGSNSIEIVEVRFNHEQPDNLTEYERIFQASLVFNYNENGIVFKRNDLSKPIFLANPELLNVNERLADDLLKKLSLKKSWSDKVISIVSKFLLKSENPEITIVADELAMSTRNLQIKLKEEGNSYQKLLNQVKKEIALNYLNKPDFSYYDVAFLLGFSEQSSFNHAFKRWTGSNPNEYRKRMILAEG